MIVAGKVNSDSFAAFRDANCVPFLNKNRFCGVGVCRQATRGQALHRPLSSHPLPVLAAEAFAGDTIHVAMKP